MKCRQCGLDKPDHKFLMARGKRYDLCYTCKNAKYREYRKEYYADKRQNDPEYRELLAQSKEKYLNSPHGQEKTKLYRETNKQVRKEQSAEWYRNNKKRRRRKSKEWAENHPDKIRDYARKRRRRNRDRPEYVLGVRLRNALYKAYRKLGRVKNSKSFQLLGYSPQVFVEHLSTFLNKPCACCGVVLTLFNSHLDHIQPLGSAANEGDIVNLNQLTNLRMICEECNLKKVADDLKFIRRKKSEQPHS